MLKMADNDKLNWMYEGSKSSLNREEYLLGKKIDANFERLQDEEKSAGPVYKVEHEILPGSVARRNLGHMQVDLARKIKEDPLFQIRKKEDQTVQDLMDNPLKRRQLEKLRAAETESSESKIKKKVKKKKSKKDLDQKLFAKMALLLQNGSDDSDGELSDEKHSKKKKKKKKHRKDSKQKRVNRSSSRSRSRSPIKTKKAKKKSRRHSSSSSSSSNSSSPDERALDHLKGNQTLFELSRQGSSGGRSGGRHENRHSAAPSGERRGDSGHRHKEHGHGGTSSRRKKEAHTADGNSGDRHRHGAGDGAERRRHRTEEGARSGRRSPERQQRPGRAPGAAPMTQEQMERKRQAMLDNARQRDRERAENVARYDHERAREERELLDRPDGGQATFVQKQMRAAAGRGTVEDRLKSNRYNIQRSAAAMDKSFVRR